MMSLQGGRIVGTMFRVSRHVIGVLATVVATDSGKRSGAIRRRRWRMTRRAEVHAMVLTLQTACTRLIADTMSQWIGV